MPQEELGRYQLFEALGEGAMGVVYRGFDPLLERKVAIKTIKLDLTPTERQEFETRFFREAKSSARLSHPNIVMVYDAGEVENIAYIAMELLEGQDLRRLMTKGKPTPIELVIEIIGGIADGLAYAHRQGVVHRDVKPANIMVLKDGGIKLADFGIAQLQTGNKTQTQALLGTPRYMAPEQISGGTVDGRADIFSLAVVLYQLLTGEAPFDGDTMTAVMYQVIYAPAPLPSDISARVPPGFNYILSKALAKDPENRYQSIEQFAIDLRRYRKLAKTPPLQWSIGGVSDQKATGKTAEPNPPESEKPPKAVPTKVKSTAPKKTNKPVWLIPVGILTCVVVGIALLSSAGTSPEAAPTANLSVTISPPTPSQPTAPAPEKPLPDAKPEATVMLAEKQEPQPATPVEIVTTVEEKPAFVLLAVAPWGEVFVNGKSKGVAPPLAKLQLAPGKYRIDIKNGGAKSFSKEVDLKEGESLRLKHKF